MTTRLLCDGLDPLELDDWADGMSVPTVEFGGPADRAVTFDKPNQDGDDDYTRLEGARVVTISMSLAEGAHTRRALLDRMARFMHASRRITLEYARHGDPPRTLRLRPMPLSLTWDNPAVMDLVWSFKTVGSPYWQGEDRTVSLVPKPPPPGRSYPRIGAGWSYPPIPAGQSISAVNAGSVDADWVLTIFGPVDGPSLRNETTGEEVRLPGLSLLDGQKAVIDSSNRRVTVDGQARFSTVDFATSVWWRIPAGQTVAVSMPVARYSDPASGLLSYADLHHS